MANRRHFSYIGYHGCEKELARRLILREVEMGKSANPYDWLGHGIYFWENDVKRALEFARDVKKCKEPFVIGAVLDLGYCGSSRKSGAWILRKVLNLWHENRRCNMDVPARGHGRAI